MDLLWEAIDISWNTPRNDGGTGQPMVFWGSPGVGKSAILSKIAEELNVHLEIIVLSVRDPSDICGLPVKVDRGVIIEPPFWAKNLVKHNGGILFFDEMNCAPPAVQAAALRIVCERYVGEIKLPDNTLIIAACNPPEEGANTIDMEPPLANRFCHLDIKPDPELFVEWLVFGKSQHINITPIDREKWDAEYSSIASVVSKFIISNRDMLQGKHTERVFASPRTWDMACRLWATCRCRDVKPYPYLQGSIGEGVTKQLYTFFIEMDLPDPRHVLEHGVKLLPDERKVDRVYACINSIMSYVIKYQEHVPRFCEILQQIKAEDIVVQCAKKIVDNNLCNSPQAVKLLENINIF